MKRKTQTQSIGQMQTIMIITHLISTKNHSNGCHCYLTFMNACMTWIVVEPIEELKHKTLEIFDYKQTNK